MRFCPSNLEGVKKLESLGFKRVVLSRELPLSEIEYICKMIKHHIYPASLINSSDNKKAFARFVRKLGIDTLDVIALSRADRLSALGEAVTQEMLEKSLNHLDELEKYYESVKDAVSSPKPLLDGKEIMQILKLKPSKVVGEIIDELIEMQLSGEIKTKEEATIYVLNRK